MSEKITPSSPQFEEACRASAQKHAKRCIRLGLLFRGAQQKAYESWLQLNKWADAQEEQSEPDNLWAAFHAAQAETEEDVHKRTEFPAQEDIHEPLYRWAELIDEHEEGLVELPMYASEKGAAGMEQQRPQAQRALVPIGTFMNEGVRYTALADTKDGSVLLRPLPGPDTTHLVLEEGSQVIPYPLSRVEIDGEEYGQVSGLVIGGLELLFARHSRGSRRHRIGFKKLSS